MNQYKFDTMSVDELWALHEEIAATLAKKLAAEKSLLEDRLRQLDHVSSGGGRVAPDPVPLNGAGARRPYPVVVQKYQNPEDPSDTWSGRGRQPRWLVAQLGAGKSMDDFLIDARPQLRSRIRVRGNRDAC